MEQFSVATAGEATASPALAEPGAAGVVNPRRRASRLGLRARATVAFGCVALALSASLAMMAYELTRSYLVEQRQSTAMPPGLRQRPAGPVGAADARPRRADHPGLAADQLGSVAVLNYQDRWFASKVGIGPNAVPASLRKEVLAGKVGPASGSGSTATRRWRWACPLPAVDAFYFEFSPMTSSTGRCRSWPGRWPWAPP